MCVEWFGVANEMTETEISAEVFNRHASGAEIDEALRLLNGLKIVRFQVEASNDPRFNTGFPPLEPPN